MRHIARFKGHDSVSVKFSYVPPELGQVPTQVLDSTQLLDLCIQQQVL